MGTLTIDLFEPGMTALHRAGLGGLACTLNWLDEANPPADRPPGSWSFDDRQVTLTWEDRPGGAGAFFEALYTLAFRLDGGLIDLHGSYWPGDLDPAVKAELQEGLSRTILQFGPNRKAASKARKVKSYDVDGQPMTVEHQDLIGYTHRGAWRDLVTGQGDLREWVEVSGTIAPGFVERHVGHSGATLIRQKPDLAVALHFALVGTLSLTIDGRSGVLIVPDVQDLLRFVRRRHLLNPRDPRACQVRSPADAALQAQVRLRSQSAGQSLRLDRCVAVLFASAGWNPNQKSRAAVLGVEAESEVLDVFERAMAIPELQPRLVLARPKKKGEAPRPFWSKGVVRPLIAENLARHEPWFKNFRRLVVSTDGSTDEQRVRLLGYEAKGLHAMIEQTTWEDRGDEVLVKSVHEAMRSRFAAIGEEASDPVTFGNRVDRQRQRWRLAFAGAKTQAEFRAALADLWSRSGHNPTLRDAWREVLPLLRDEERWQLARDLTLLALASYKSERTTENGSGTPAGPAVP
jgi:CRISPR-associated protein Cas8a1/Csx13